MVQNGIDRSFHAEQCAFYRHGSVWSSKSLDEKLKQDFFFANFVPISFIDVRLLIGYLWIAHMARFIAHKNMLSRGYRAEKKNGFVGFVLFSFDQSTVDSPFFILTKFAKFKVKVVFNKSLQHSAMYSVLRLLRF